MNSCVECEGECPIYYVRIIYDGGDVEIREALACESPASFGGPSVLEVEEVNEW